ncbi:MAG: CotS family spore coat protein [Sarcina sp.]
MKIKYRDAKYLCKYDLEIDFFENSNIKIRDLWPNRNIYILDTDQGKKILKMVNYDEKKLNYIIKMLQFVGKSYKNIISYHEFSEGKYFVDWKNNRYIILDLIDGGEFNIYNPTDLKKVIKGLSDFHRASRGIKESLTTLELKESKLLELEEEFIDGKKKLYKYKELAENKIIKNEFDEIFLSNFDYYMERVTKAVELLKNSSYENLCSLNNAIALCHNDLAYHNILINEDEVFFIDFDYCSVDLKVLDLYSFINKIIKRIGFDYYQYKDIIESYRKNIEFSKEEEEILEILFIYPKDFLNIVDNYYSSKKDWNFESYLGKLKEKINYIKEYEQFITKIK